MKIDRISYQKTYPTGQYANEKIGMEASIDESEQDHLPMIAELLKGKCDAIHKANNPHIYQEQYSTQPLVVNQPEHIKITSPPEEKISPEQEIANTISEIENATSETLHTFQLQAAKNQRTMDAYNKKKKQLNIQ